MASLFFPQLSSGALAQYPLRKTRHLRTLMNSLPDGSVIVLPDSHSGRLKWELVYQDLSPADRDLLVDHFEACAGPWLPFVFIDPTENMLSNSTNFNGNSWELGSGLQLQAGAPDPFGSSGAFVVTNNGQTNEEISQTMNVPGGYQYCFSIYAASTPASQVELIRRAGAEQNDLLDTAVSWTRLVSSGQIAGSTEDTFTVAISIPAGQQISLYGPQLEPQKSPSRYRATAGTGGVYPNAHWAVNNLTITSDSPSQFSVRCMIETNT